MTAVESALAARPPVGLDLEVLSDLPPHVALFGEGPSRILLSISPGHREALGCLAEEMDVPVKLVGRVTAGPVRVVYNGAALISTDIARIHRAWDRGLQRWLHPEIEEVAGP